MDLRFVAVAQDWASGVLNSTWNWFNSLHYQEWFLLLGMVAGLGFLCMRGFAHHGRA